jgi:hypothetical protein
MYNLEGEFVVYLGRFVGYEIHCKMHRQIQQFPDVVSTEKEIHLGPLVDSPRIVNHLPNRL